MMNGSPFDDDEVYVNLSNYLNYLWGFRVWLRNIFAFVVLTLFAYNCCLGRKKRQPEHFITDEKDDDNKQLEEWKVIKIIKLIK